MGFDAFSESAAGVEEFVGGHDLEESEASGCADERAGVIVEPFASEAGFDAIVLGDLDSLGEFGEGAVVFVAGEGGVSLGDVCVEEGLVHDGEHVERDGDEDVCFAGGETIPDVAAARIEG
jgi:hypothetical protein